MDTSKLAELQKSVRIGGKGAPRRKMRRAPPPKVVHVEDKKITSTLKRLNVHSIENIEEVNLFKEDGSVLHISQPKVQASVYANTFAVQGRVQERDLSDMLPNVLPQLGPQSQPLLQKLVEKMGGIQALQDAVPADFPGKHLLRPDAASASIDAAPADAINDNDDDDDDVPELVENFDEDMD